MPIVGLSISQVGRELARDFRTACAGNENSELWGHLRFELHRQRSGKANTYSGQAALTDYPSLRGIDLNDTDPNRTCRCENSVVTPWG